MAFELQADHTHCDSRDSEEVTRQWRVGLRQQFGESYT